MITFANPEYFLILLIIPFIIIFEFKKNKKPHLRISSLKFLSLAKPTIRTRLKRLPFFFTTIALILFIIALARPQTSSTNKKITTEGIDIILTLDVSTSMKAQDFKPNRFKAAVKVAKEFIKGRQNDRIGVVVFAGESYTQCPLTSDYNVIIELVNKIKMQQIEDGTAIGTAIINSVNRLRDSKAKSKVIILLTDGANNKGEVDPETAARTAEALGIRIYTIGIGKKVAPYPFKGVFGRTVTRNVNFDIDDKMLTNIATMTKAKYFKAESKSKLKEIYKAIDKLEKTKINTKTYKRYSEKFFPFALIGLIFLLSSFILKHTYFRYHA